VTFFARSCFGSLLLSNIKIAEGIFEFPKSASKVLSIAIFCDWDALKISFEQKMHKVQKSLPKKPSLGCALGVLGGESAF
jgi:hypothetical protein